MMMMMTMIFMMTMVVMMMVMMMCSAFEGDQGATQYSAKSAKKGQMGSRLLTYPTQVDVTLMLPMMMIVRVISKFHCDL